MARKPVTWCMAAPADGTIELSRQPGTPVSLADHVGQIVDHPKPSAVKWFDESHFSYFRMVKRVGEALQDTGIRPVTWPVRLWSQARSLDNRAACCSAVPGGLRGHSGSSKDSRNNHTSASNLRTFGSRARSAAFKSN